MFKFLCILSLILAFSCDDGKKKNQTNNTNNVNNANNVNNVNNANNQQPVCGDGVIEGTEVCDLADLAGATCESVDGTAYKGGELRCNDTCTGYDESLCIPQDCPESLSFVMRLLDSEERVKLCDFAGQVILMVNTASQCGYTYQYSQLQTLYTTYGDQGFVILGFPSNNFMNQEPGDECDINDFITGTYGVTFPMFEKIFVVGAGMHPLYEYLTTQTGDLSGAIQWNFTKFLLARDGTVTYRFATNVDPNRDVVSTAIEELLAE